MIDLNSIYKYENNKQMRYVNYSDEFIKKTYSSKNFKINKAFIDFIHEFDYLWLDENYSSGYMITPLKNLLMNIEFIEKPTSEHNALFLNLTQPYFIDNFWRLVNNHNIIKTIYGDTGSGKSFIGLNENYLNKVFLNKVMGWDVNFNKDNICFSRQEILNLVPELKRGESVQMDEDNEGVLGVGSFSSKDFVNRFEKTLRSMSKNFYNMNPYIQQHNEHYIIKALGYNEDLLTNKLIFRERESLFYGFSLLPSFKDNAYKKLLSDYAFKKKSFQNALENQKGDDSRTKRMLNMAVFLIQKYGLTYKMKSTFKLLVGNEYKLSIADNAQLVNLMGCLLDSRLNMFEDYKNKVRDFIYDK